MSALLFALLYACSSPAPAPAPTPAPAPAPPPSGPPFQRCSVTDPAQLQAIAGIATVAASCAADPGPSLGSVQPFQHPVEHLPLSKLGANHRGRDAFFAVGEPQWVMGKFSYGPNDQDLKDELVEIYLLRGCSGTWENLGTATTTREKQHPTVEGVEDSGGRVYFQLPPEKALGIGRHRIRMVVKGDQSGADQYIEVLPKGAAIFVTDVDGTLTERKETDPSAACDEESDFPAVWREQRNGNDQPNVHVGVASAFQGLVAMGYRPLYLTARPEWLLPHTRGFMAEANRRDGRGDLPLGIIHTTTGLTGALNSAAVTFKMGEVQALVDKGFSVEWAFGNRPSDVETYTFFKIPYRYYHQNDDAGRRNCSKITGEPDLVNKVSPQTGDWRISTYEDIVPLVAARGAACGG